MFTYIQVLLDLCQGESRQVLKLKVSRNDNYTITFCACKNLIMLVGRKKKTQLVNVAQGHQHKHVYKITHSIFLGMHQQKSI